MTPKELLEEYLVKIDWELVHVGGNHFTVRNHEGIDTDYMFWDSCIELRTNGTVCAFKICEESIRMLSASTISIGNCSDCFILLMNHDIKET